MKRPPLDEIRRQPPLDFWSEPIPENPITVSLGVAALTIALPNVTVDDLPDGAVVIRAIAIFMARMIGNTNAGANKLNGGTVAATSQVIQVDDSIATGYVDAINFVDDQFGLAATTREGGPVCIGSMNVSAIVDGNDVYSFRWLLSRADLNNLNFHDAQIGLRIWYLI